MHNRELYEPFSEDQLYNIICRNWSLYREALIHEFNYGSDNVFSEMYIDIDSLLVYDRELLLDKISLMDKYIHRLNKYKEKNG